MLWIEATDSRRHSKAIGFADAGQRVCRWGPAGLQMRASGLADAGQRVCRCGPASLQMQAMANTNKGHIHYKSNKIQKTSNKKCNQLKLADCKWFLDTV